MAIHKPTGMPATKPCMLCGGDKPLLFVMRGNYLDYVCANDDSGCNTDDDYDHDDDGRPLWWTSTKRKTLSDLKRRIGYARFVAAEDADLEFDVASAGL